MRCYCVYCLRQFSDFSLLASSSPWETHELEGVLSFIVQNFIPLVAVDEHCSVVEGKRPDKGPITYIRDTQ